MYASNQNKEQPEHRKMLQRVAELDFGDPGSKAFIQLQNDIKKPEYIELLHTLGNRGYQSFCDTKGDEFLKWMLMDVKDSKPRDLLHVKTKVDERKTPIHQAITSKNVALLECILSMTEESTQDASTLNAEIVAALRTRDMTNAKRTCLHASITARLPCVEKMVELCAHVEGRDQETLARTVRSRNIPEQDAAQGQGLESIFLMRDYYGNTPLHLLMEVSKMSWPEVVPPDEHRDCHTNHEFRPIDVVSMITNVVGDTIGDLWTATDGDGRSPYNRLLHVIPKPNEKEKEFQETVRAEIFSSLTEIPRLKRALYGTRGQGKCFHLCPAEKELCLDMSDFSQSSHDFNKFVHELKMSPDQSPLFEECLISVFLPNLNTFNKKTPHEGVPELFEWLSVHGNVKRLKSLNIPDSTTSPMSDELVADAVLDRFEIEKFDWRKLDINLDVLIQSSHAKDFTEITLYSTGNFSVLYHWVSPHGLAMFPKLRKVTIEIVKLNSVNQTSQSQKRHNELVKVYQQKLSERLEAMKDTKMRNDPSIAFTYNIKVDAEWDFRTDTYSLSPLSDKLELLKKLEACHNFLKRLKNRPEYTDYYERFDRLRADPKESDTSQLIKVAIIDNGADKFQKTIRTKIEKGVSYVKADAESTDRILPWWMVSDPHGTQMASLITAANPWCRLYIARVGKNRKDILPEDAVQAVEWAIEQEVDVISISWITKTRVPELETAIKDAAKKTLVFCSTADEGTWSGSVFPARYDGTVRVSATDKYGNLMPASDKHAIDIPVPGEDIPARGPAYMGGGIAKGTVSGSSVATALAAGIASLALLLLQVFNDADRAKLLNEGFYKNETMVALLLRINDTTSLPSLFPVIIDAKTFPGIWNLEELRRK